MILFAQPYDEIASGRFFGLRARSVACGHEEAGLGIAAKVNSHRLKAVARVTGCKPSFRPKAGRMGPAPSGLQEVDGLNHLLGNLHPDRYFDQLYTSQSPRPSHCLNCSRSSRAPTSAAPKTAS